MLPVHIQDLFGGDEIKFDGELYTVIEVSRNVRQQNRYWLKARGKDSQDLLEVLLPEDFVILKKVTKPAKPIRNYEFTDAPRFAPSASVLN
jgi:hypothetical protein